MFFKDRKRRFSVLIMVVALATMPVVGIMMMSESMREQWIAQKFTLLGGATLENTIGFLSFCYILFFMGMSYFAGKSKRNLQNNHTIIEDKSILGKEKTEINAIIKPYIADTTILEKSRLQHKEEENTINAERTKCVLEYAQEEMAPYMDDRELSVLCTDIQRYVVDFNTTLVPVRTNGGLATVDLQHFAWNIGERMKWTGEQRAVFIKKVFPEEFKNVEINSIRRTLRKQQAMCHIEIDIPKNGEFSFCKTGS